MSDGAAYDCLVRFHVSPSIGSRVSTIHIDGNTVDVRYSGTRDIPVRCGTYLVHAYASWIWRHGEVDLLVDVDPGDVIDIYYAPPHHHFAKGSIGLLPQRGKGLTAAVGGIVVIVAFALYLAAGSFLAELIDRITG
ncbi:hypothetical protein ACFT2C_17950 [Promicromonospora sp. NPDC057138]|uniref:hypothetical protein n=1 Tax=Promicromonospora sp. NPDC057138 TaxID=3346031 RepID=UPI0036278796